MAGERHRTESGFTLIELMIVVSIIAILAAIAIPKFASLIRQSGEGTCKGNLGAIRAALDIYYGDMEGTFPSNLPSLTISEKYLAALPTAKTPNYHQDTTSTRYGFNGTEDDAGGWQYNNVASAVNVGTVWVNCTHTDTHGSKWTSY